MSSTPRYFFTIRPNGRFAVRYWMADNTSVFIAEHPSRGAAEAAVAKLNA